MHTMLVRVAPRRAACRIARRLLATEAAAAVAVDASSSTSQSASSQTASASQAPLPPSRMAMRRSDPPLSALFPSDLAPAAAPAGGASHFGTQAADAVLPEVAPPSSQPADAQPFLDPLVAPHDHDTAAVTKLEDAVDDTTPSAPAEQGEIPATAFVDLPPPPTPPTRSIDGVTKSSSSSSKTASSARSTASASAAALRADAAAAAEAVGPGPEGERGMDTMTYDTAAAVGEGLQQGGGGGVSYEDQVLAGEFRTEEKVIGGDEDDYFKSISSRGRFRRDVKTESVDQLSDVYRQAEQTAKAGDHVEMIKRALESNDEDRRVHPNELRRRFHLAWRAYENLVSAGRKAPPFAYRLLFRAVGSLSAGDKAVQLRDQAIEDNIELTEGMANNLIIAFAKDRKGHLAYREFEALKERELKVSEHAYICLINVRDVEGAARVFESMLVEYKDEPPRGSVVSAILDAGIEQGLSKPLHKAVEVVRAHPTLPIDRGLGLQVMNLAARLGDESLANDMFWCLDARNLLRNAPHEAQLAYSAVVQAFARAKNDRVLMKVLNELAILNQDGRVKEPSHGTLSTIAKELATSADRLDNAYHILVQLQNDYKAHQEASPEEQEGLRKKGSAPLPVSAHAAYVVLLGCAYAAQLDRAFATFEDYQPVFGLSYDTRACNALLLACQRMRTNQERAAHSVLQEMEKLGVSADANTFHIMLKIVMQSTDGPDEEDKVATVLRYMQGGLIRPLPQSLKLLSLWYALNGDHDKSAMYLQDLKNTGAFVPSYFERRLKQIKRNGDRI